MKTRYPERYKELKNITSSNWYNILKTSQNIEYMTSRLGLDKELGSSVLSYLSKLDGLKKKYILNKIKKNIELINMRRDEIINNPSFIEKLFPFKSNEVKFKDKIIQITQNKDERKWIQNLVNSGKINLEEDFFKLKMLFKDFHSIGLGKNINEFKDDSALFDYVRNFKSDKQIEYPDSGWELIEETTVDGFDVKLIKITSENAMRMIGANSNWCVAYGAFEDYQPSLFYCFIINGEPEVLIHKETDQIRDRNDGVLENEYIKYIEDLVEKYNLNTHDGDFNTYDISLDTMHKIFDSIARKEDLSSYIKEKPYNINLFPQDKLIKYMPLLMKDFYFLNMDNLNSDVLSSLGDYVKLHDLPEKSILENEAISEAINNTSGYLKNIPKSWRTKDSNRVFTVLRDADSLTEMQQMKIKNHDLEGKLELFGPEISKKYYMNYIYENILNLSRIPENLKEDPDILKMEKIGWIKLIIENPMINIPEELRNDPEIIDITMKSWIQILKSYPYSFFSKNFPEQLKNDPKIIESLKDGFINILKNQLFFAMSSKSNNSLMKIFQGDPEIDAALKTALIRTLKSYPYSFFSKTFPEQLKNDPEIIKSLKDGLINKLKNDLLSAMSSDLTDSLIKMFQGDPEINAALKTGFINIAKDDPLNKNIPKELMDDPEMIEGIKSGLIKTLLKFPNNYEFQTFPEQFKNDPDILTARKQGWINVIKIDPFRHIVNDMPEDIGSDPEIYQIKKRVFMKILEENVNIWNSERFPPDLKHDKDMQNLVQKKQHEESNEMLKFDSTNNWYKIVKKASKWDWAINAEVPPAPGAIEIPSDHIRLYHYTNRRGDLHESAESLRNDGIDINFAKGHTYGEPDVIWASTDKPHDQKVYAEFSISLNDPRWVIGKPSGDLEEYQKSSHNVYFSDSIKPEEILAVHEPWHFSYRRALKYNSSYLRKIVESDYSISSIENPLIGPAIIKLKHEFKDKI